MPTRAEAKSRLRRQGGDRVETALAPYLEGAECADHGRVTQQAVDGHGLRNIKALQHLSGQGLADRAPLP